MNRTTLSLVLMLAAMAAASWFLLRWQPVDNRQLQVFRGHHGSVERLAVSPDGVYAFSAATGRDFHGHTNYRELLVCNLSSGTESAHYRFRADDVPDFRFHPLTGNFLAARNDGIAGTIESWDTRLAAEGNLASGTPIYRTPGRRVERFDISADGKTLALIESELDIRTNRMFWLVTADAVTGKPTGNLAYGAFRCVSFSADGKTVFTDGSGKEVLVCTSDARLITNLGSDRGEILSLSVSSDGSNLAACRVFAERNIYTDSLVSKPLDRVVLRSRLLLWKLPDYRTEILREDYGNSLAADWIAGGKWIALGGLYRLDLYDPLAKTNRFSLRGHAGRVFVTRDIANTGKILSGGADGTMRVWSLVPLVNKNGEKK
jgi:WD40 repeat protein